MTLLHFTLGALPYHNPKLGTHIVHAYLSQSEMTRTDDPGDERKAAKDARLIVNNLLRDNITEDDELLLCDGEMPPEADPIFTFAIGVAWDRNSRSPAYKAMDYATLDGDPRYTKVSPIGRDLYDYTFDVLKKREQEEHKAAGAHKYAWDAITVKYGHALFDRFCRRLKLRHTAWGINKMRFDCPNLRSGFCSPSKPTCPCYNNGKCVEVKA